MATHHVRLRSIAISTVALAALPFLPTAGHADTIGNVTAKIAAAQHQLNALQTRTEAASQAYDAGQIALAAAQRGVQQAVAAQARAEAAVQSLSAQMGSVVAAAYRSGGLGPLAALTDGGPQSFLDRASSLQALSARDASTLAAFTAAHQTQQQDAAAAHQALLGQQKATAHLAAERAVIVSAAQHEQTLLSTLRAEQHRLVVQAEQAVAAAARAKAAAAARAAAAAQLALAQQQAAALAQQQAETAAAQSAFQTQSSSTLAPASYSAGTPAGPAPSDSSGSSPAPSGSGGASTALAWARNEIGKPYVWGAAGPDSFDCSGLTQFVWGKAGVSLAHYTGAQWNEGRHVSNLQPGDLVFFDNLGHVGIYAGNGMMIDAPHSGAYVREEPIAGFGQFDGAVRVQG